MAPASARFARRDDGGSVFVEFAATSVMLFTLILLIMALGFLLDFKHGLSQAAAEGARVGAVATDDDSTPLVDEREEQAIAAMENSVNETGQTCGANGMTCTVTIHDCGQDPALGDSVLTPDCVTIELLYDYASNPIFPGPPILQGVIPDTIASSSTAQLNP